MYCKDKVNARYYHIDYLTSFYICSLKNKPELQLFGPKRHVLLQTLLGQCAYSSVSSDCIQIFLEPLGIISCL